MLRFQGKILGKDSDHYATPTLFYSQLNKIYNFTMDPCPLKSRVDGLIMNWEGVVYCNPPYSNIYPWLKKGEIELNRMPKNEYACFRIVYLLPVRTDTKYFHDFIMKKAYSITFIKGRLHFNDDKNPAPFPVMLVELDYQSINTDTPIKFFSMLVTKENNKQINLFSKGR